MMRSHLSDDLASVAAVAVFPSDIFTFPSFLLQRLFIFAPSEFIESVSERWDIVLVDFVAVDRCVGFLKLKEGGCGHRR